MGLRQAWSSFQEHASLPCPGRSMPAARSKNRPCSLSCAERLETRDQTLLCQLLYRLCYRGAVSILLIINSFLPSDSWPPSHLHWEPATSSQHSTQAHSQRRHKKPQASLVSSWGSLPSLWQQLDKGEQTRPSQCGEESWESSCPLCKLSPLHRGIAYLNSIKVKTENTKQRCPILWHW